MEQDMQVPVRKPWFKAVAAGFSLGLVISGAVWARSATADDPPRSKLAGAPAGSLLPGEPSAPQGSIDLPKPTAGKPIEFDRFRILPAGSVPASEYGFFPTDTKLEQGWDFRNPAQVAAAKRLVPTIGAVAPPPGFTLRQGGGSVITTVTGGLYVPLEYYEFARSDQFPVEVRIRLIKPGSTVELIDYAPGVGLAMATLTIQSTTLVVVHGTADAKVQPISQAWFMVGNYLINVDAPALPPGIFSDFLNSLVTGESARLTQMSIAAAAATGTKESRP